MPASDEPIWRGPLRLAVWIALLVCALLDGGIGEYMISGSDVLYLDDHERFVSRPPLDFSVGIRRWPHSHPSNSHPYRDTAQENPDASNDIPPRPPILLREQPSVASASPA